MSEIKLNLLDSNSLLIATVHASVGDALVASLSAEPETIDELVAALGRFEKCTSIPASSLHRQKRSAIDEVPYDAGILVIDLASRIVACESTYLLPMREGRIDIYDYKQDMGLTLRYQLSDDWIFLRSIEEYQARSEKRLTEHASTIPLDIRATLYGQPLLDFIVQNAKLLASSVANVRYALACRDLSNTDPSDNTTALQHTSLETYDCAAQHRDLMYETVVDIHRRWLMTQRDDLNGASPREVLFAKRNLIDGDLSSRAGQWGYFLEEPPPLSRDSHAYRFAGFGTHEWVIYYYLVRYLAWEAIDLLTQRPKVGDSSSNENRGGALIENNSSPSVRSQAEPAPSSTDYSALDSPADLPISFSPSFSLGSRDSQRPKTVSTVSSDSSLIAHLEFLEAQWLTKPNPEFSFSIPAEIIDNERRRRPEAMTGRSMVIDEDCLCCKMMGDESEAGLGIYFTHYDGCNMEDEFAFSWFATLEEWEEEQRRYDEWERERSATEKAISTNQLPENDDIPF